MKLYVLGIECIKKSLLCQKIQTDSLSHMWRVVTCAIENTLNIYPISKLFLETSCVTLWKLMSNWLTGKFGRRQFIHVLYYLCTEGIDYTAGILLLISRVHARQVQKFFFNFNSIVWMNTFCHTVCCTWHICAVEQIMLWASWHSHKI